MSTGTPVISPPPSASIACMSAHGKVSSIPNSSPILLAAMACARFAGTPPTPMQSAGLMQRSYERWDSAQLGRPMEFLWFGWSGYPVVCFPTSMGRFHPIRGHGHRRAARRKDRRGLDAARMRRLGRRRKLVQRVRAAGGARAAAGAVRRLSDPGVDAVRARARAAARRRFVRLFSSAATTPPISRGAIRRPSPRPSACRASTTSTAFSPATGTTPTTTTARAPTLPTWTRR